MKLTWYGHACFKLETAEGSVVFDPYESNYLPNLTLPEICADAVVCSHGHGDHSAAGLVTLTGNTPTFRMTQVACFHDEVMGLKRGKNLITVIEAEGLRVAHFGDLGHELSRAQLRELGSIDIALMPVGGVYTVDARTAKMVCEKLLPSFIVPMHYKTGNAGLQNVAEVDDFLSLYHESKVLRLEGSTWNIGKTPRSVVVFELC
ncbi:MAG: MBL fold metallo-hydrolase [Bacillota bacterium]|nr:MBL fold metallo-hydrolase [Bacillota bacterium]